MSEMAKSRWVGWLSLLDRVSVKLSRGHARIYIYLICAQPIGGSNYSTVRDDPQTVVKRVLPDDALTAFFPRPCEVNRQRFERGTICFAATVKGDFAGHIWLARGAYDEDEVRCRYELPEDQRSVWDFDVYIEPKYRLGRTLGRLWKGVDAAQSALGVMWSISRISLFNIASVQTHERLGAKHVSTAVFFKLWSIQLAIFSRTPFVHLSLHTHQIPAFGLTVPGRHVDGH